MKTKIDVAMASSSGSRTCFLCEEKIQDRTIIVDFATHDGEDYIERSVSNICLHTFLCCKSFTGPDNFGKILKMNTQMEIARDNDLTTSEIEARLRSQLRLYTSLWYITQTDQSANLPLTFILTRCILTLQLIDDLKRMAVLGR